MKTLAACLLLLWSGAVLADSPAICDETWEATINLDTKAVVADQIKQMEGVHAQCADTGVYEQRLAMLYQLAHRFVDEERIVLEGLKYSPDDKKLSYLLMKAHTYENKLDLAHQEAQSLITKYPHFSGGYDGLGNIALLKNDYQTAISMFKKSNELDPEADTYALLAAAYYDVDDYSDSVESMRKSIAMDPNELLRQSDTIIATAASFVKMGRYEEARDLLKKALNPAVRANPFCSKLESVIQAHLHD